MKNWFNRRLVTALLGAAPCVGFCMLSLTGVQDVRASAPVEKAQCQVHAVLLSQVGNGKIPKRLAFLKEHLEPSDLAFYKGFHLLDSKLYDLRQGTALDRGFKTGHELRLTLAGGDGGKLKFRAKLSGRDGKTDLINTQFSIADNGLIMLSPGNYTSGEVSGKLLFPVHCKSR